MSIVARNIKILEHFASRTFNDEDKRSFRKLIMLTFASWYESSWNFIIVINYVQKHWRKSKLQNYETTSMFVLSSYVSFSLAVLWGFYRLDYGSGRVLYGRKKQLTCSSNATNSNADKERNRSIEKSTTLLDQWKVSMKRQSINVDRFGLKYIKVFLTSAPKSDSPRTMIRVPAGVCVFHKFFEIWPSLSLYHKFHFSPNS